MAPKVSVCLPNLNTRPFLAERLDCILAQSFGDWELVICDNFSDDGAWEIFKQYAARDARIRIHQEPRAGMYANWNNCVRRAQGEYIYIATSDDTMMPDCLEKMVAALDANAECGLCQCELLIIDEHGRVHADDGWSTWLNYAPEWKGREHKRLAPHDGLLHFALRTVYTSITQLLIRKTVFERVGYFDPRFGSCGDFEWEMRAALLYDVVYLPQKLATWRKHLSQATKPSENSANRALMLKMSQVAFERARGLEPVALGEISLRGWLRFYRQQYFDFALAERGTRARRLVFLLIEAVLFNPSAWRHLASRVRGEPKADMRVELRRKLAALPGSQLVIPVVR